MKAMSSAAASMPRLKLACAAALKPSKVPSPEPFDTLSTVDFGALLTLEVTWILVASSCRLDETGFRPITLTSAELQLPATLSVRQPSFTSWVNLVSKSLTKLSRVAFPEPSLAFHLLMTSSSISTSGVKVNTTSESCVLASSFSSVAISSATASDSLMDIVENPRLEPLPTNSFSCSMYAGISSVSIFLMKSLMSSSASAEVAAPRILDFSFTMTLLPSTDRGSVSASAMMVPGGATTCSSRIMRRLMLAC
mmetsp:Transcript_15333/g.41462  ORF Transcript_15333/g.41462 Transcript_15333/m.41462 type:complete len:252 (-) Transcript_15333:999-1754(-)